MRACILELYSNCGGSFVRKYDGFFVCDLEQLYFKADTCCNFTYARGPDFAQRYQIQQHNHKKRTNTIIIDFGKATSMQCPSRYNLTLALRQKYKTKYQHLAPDLVDGLTTQTVYTDIYSVDHVFKQIHDYANLTFLEDLSQKMMKSSS